ncbi:cupin domain-containing protein [Acidobacteria bacterium AB60]|nr:cupin domain-containing protein [Acidobacteria bacterium AB60]
MINKRGMLAGAAVVLACGAALVAQEMAQRSSRTAFTHTLPELKGDHLRVDLVEVNYGPSAGSPPHSHPCPVIGYVLEGTVRMQVRGQVEATYTAGQSFYEDPNGAHIVSANDSQSKPAKFLAFFVCDHDGPLSTPISGAQR